jgi:hypothetical protein
MLFFPINWSGPGSDDQRDRNVIRSLRRSRVQPERPALNLKVLLERAARSQAAALDKLIGGSP